MAARVVLSDAALDDLERLRGWLTQPGAGRRGRDAARRILVAIRGLASTAKRHPVDRFRAGHRQMAVAGHVVSYRCVDDPAGDIVFVARIYGPGRDRP